MCTAQKTEHEGKDLVAFGKVEYLCYETAEELDVTVMRRGTGTEKVPHTDRARAGNRV